MLLIKTVNMNGLRMRSQCLLLISTLSDVKESGNHSNIIRKRKHLRNFKDWLLRLGGLMRSWFGILRTGMIRYEGLRSFGHPELPRLRGKSSSMHALPNLMAYIPTATC